MRVSVSIRRLPHAEGLPLPAYQTSQAAGADRQGVAKPTLDITLRQPDRLGQGLTPGQECRNRR